MRPPLAFLFPATSVSRCAHILKQEVGVGEEDDAVQRGHCVGTGLQGRDVAVGASDRRNPDAKSAAHRALFTFSLVMASLRGPTLARATDIARQNFSPDRVLGD